jgi:hypothetical protein
MMDIVARYTLLMQPGSRTSQTTTRQSGKDYVAVGPSRNPCYLVGLATQACVAAKPSRGVQACTVHRLEDYLRVPRLLEELATQCCVALSRVPMRSRTAVGAIAERSAGVRGPFPGSAAWPEHHERYDYDVRGNGCSRSFTDCLHRTGVMRGDIHGVHYRNDNEGFRPVAPDPYVLDNHKARVGNKHSPDSRRSPTPSRIQ